MEGAGERELSPKKEEEGKETATAKKKPHGMNGKLLSSLEHAPLLYSAVFSLHSRFRAYAQNVHCTMLQLRWVRNVLASTVGFSDT